MKKRIAVFVLLIVVLLLSTGCMRIAEKAIDTLEEEIGTALQENEMPFLSFDKEEEAPVSGEEPGMAPEQEGDSEWMWDDAEPYNVLLCDFSASAYEVNDCTVMECALDLNGDSVTELTVRVGEGYREHQLLVSTEAVDFECYFGEGHLNLTRAMVADLYPDDGAIEIFVSGDWASADYVTFAWRYDGEQLIEIADAELGYAGGTYGEINGFEGDLILLRRDIDVMGTWWGEQAYVLDYANGGPANLTETEPRMVKDGYWMHTDPLYEKDPLVVAKDLTAFLPDGEMKVLPAGTTLEIAYIADNDSFYEVNCLLADGTGVYLIAEICTEDDRYVLYINGEPEEYWFEMLPYSG